jgi:hypothetical protein
VSGIVWLASYPKSGNTWFRLWLANLERDTAADINRQLGTAGLASARNPFDRRTLLSSGDLTDDECERLRPAVYRMIGREIADLPAIRRVWNPRDVVASLAHHERCSKDEAIALMEQDDAAFSATSSSQANQMRQRLGNWSSFQDGWLKQTVLPCHVVRYEDMQQSPCGTLAAALEFVGVEARPDAIETSVRLSDFEAARAQEQRGGFVEAPGLLTGGFFRRGISGGWHDELSPCQAQRVADTHRTTMEKLGYRS